jgi:SARP family transcriptional regulator, regulator of embCAB operon
VLSEEVGHVFTVNSGGRMPSQSNACRMTIRLGFLPGEDAPWIGEIRHQLAELHLRALECYAAAGLGLGGTELTAAAVRAGRQLTRLAPLRGSGYRYLMQALAAEGNLAEALDVYGQLSGCLRDQLGVSPSPASRELYERLLAAT